MKHIKSFRTIGFSKLQNGEEYYSFTSINNVEKTLVYQSREDKFFLLDYDRKDIELWEEAKEQILATRRDFIKILCGILKDEGGFHIAKGEHYMIAYRKEFRRDCKKETYLYSKEERNDFYRFVIFLGNGKVVQNLCTVDDLLNFRFVPHSWCSALSHGGKMRKILYDLQNESFPLMQSAKEHDRYLYLTMKCLAGTATQEEADEASAIDGKPRFVSSDKVYGEEVKISDVEQIPPSFFARSERYSCTVTIGSRNWNATWYPKQHCLHIWQYSSCTDSTIKISDEVYESLRKQAVKKYLSARG